MFFLLLIVGVVASGLYQLAAPEGASAAAPTQTAGATRVEVRVVRQNGALILSVMGSAPAGAFIGCSMYPRGARSATTDGTHMVEAINTSFGKAWKVPDAMVGGSFEIAVWASKVPKAQCRIPNDPWCKRNGFHMEGMLAYRKGQLF